MSQKNYTTLFERAVDVFGYVIDYLRKGRGKDDDVNVIKQITEVRRPYGFVRKYFRNNKERFSELREKLNQSRIAVPYDVYLTKATAYAVFAAIAGVFLGMLATVYLSSVGALEGV
ncbi:MAG: hypothetical protein SXQ77_04270, partial [Halobacteria archaeon]|nr:hypothetical protein [Halobacteria archaeon]